MPRLCKGVKSQEVNEPGTAGKSLIEAILFNKAPVKIPLNLLIFTSWKPQGATFLNRQNTVPIRFAASTPFISAASACSISPATVI